jgi:hypothetical protein
MATPGDINKRIVQGLLNVTVVDNMMPIQNAETLQTLHHLLTEPEGYYNHFRRYSTAVILASVFEQREDRFESPKIQTLYNSQDRFTKLLEPGATPPCRCFPVSSLPTGIYVQLEKRSKGSSKDSVVHVL